MLPRFYAPDLEPAAGATVYLSPDESHHLARVMRLMTGDHVAVFDGRGVEWRGRVANASRDSARITLTEAVPSRLPVVALSVVQGVLRGDAMEDVVRDCTMAGVAAIHPVVSARTSVKHSALRGAADRWRRIALSSAKQCGIARLPDLYDLLSFEDWLSDGVPEATFLLVEPDAAPSDVVTVRQLATAPVPPAAALLIGPEGGWSLEERDAALAAGARPLSLGPLTLRARTVALAASAALIAIWE